MLYIVCTLNILCNLLYLFLDEEYFLLKDELWSSLVSCTFQSFFLELRNAKRFPPKFKLIVHYHTNKILELFPKMTHVYYVFTLNLAFLIPNLGLLNWGLPILFSKYLCTCGYLWNHLQVLEDQRYHKILSIYIHCQF